MRILFLIHGYPPDVIGGHEVRCQRTAEGLQQRGHDVLVLTTYRRENGPSKESFVWRLLRSKWSEAPKHSAFKWVFVYRHNIKVYRQVLQEFQPDVVYRWGLDWCTAAFVRYVHEATPLPVVVAVGGVIPAIPDDLWFHFCRTPAKGLVRNLIKKVLIKFTSFWIPISPQPITCETATFLSHFDLKQCLLQGWKVRKPIVIYAGVDMAQFPLRLPSDYRHPPRFIYIARLDPEKDGLTVVRAMYQLANQGKPIEGTLVAGTSLNINYYREVIKHLKTLGGKVKLLNEVSPIQIPTLLRSHDAFIFASSPGWIGNAALEAMACGLAPIISSFEDVDGILKDGENCLLYPFGDADALAERMERLIKEPNLVIKLGQNARRLIEERFTLERYLDETEELLESVIRDA
jgi:glycosyltransferase involved in cell wall biosynthesis